MAPHRPLPAVIAAVAAVTLILTPAVAYGQQPEPATPAGLAAAGQDEQLPAFDSRHGPGGTDRPAATAAAPTAAVPDGASIRWTPFGTVQSMVGTGELLATDLSGADPVAAAREWLDRYPEAFGHGAADDLAVHADVAVGDDARAVVFQQQVAGLPVSPEGFGQVGLVGSPEDGWSVAYASSMFVPAAPLEGSFRVSTREAFTAAAGDAGVSVAVPDLTLAGIRNGWLVLDSAAPAADRPGAEQLVRPVAFPVPGEGIRPAYETVYFDGMSEGYRSVIDGGTGELLFRESIVSQLADNPRFDVFPATPPMSRRGQPPWHYPPADTRNLWCWSSAPGCRLVVDNGASPVAWDVDPTTGEPTFTTSGNAVTAFESWTGGIGHMPQSPTRDYRFGWSNAWHGSGCHPDNLTPGGNDIDASVTNLFVANWRMHDWTYHLGFTEETWNPQQVNFGVNPDGEGDPVLARAQAGAIQPGSRNNASMGTPPDGGSPVMSMFLWQPGVSDFYGPCVVGDYDHTVIGHEFGHTIENRLIGKGFGRSGFHAGAMGESWSDFISMEHLFEYGFRTPGGDQWAAGQYDTGDQFRGIRNYNMSHPRTGDFPEPGRDVRVGPLQFGSMGYDLVGPQVHADSQIWSAVNYDIRSLFLDRYPQRGGPGVQRECADGQRPVDDCPGNRRWIQLVFDAMILMPTAPTMLDARDAYFAADLMRFGGANQDLLWEGFAKRGFGQHASVEGTQDTNPVPDFSSPLHEPATLRFEAFAQDEGGAPVDADVFVGDHEARATPIAPVTEFLPDADGYQFVARAEGYGHVRFRVEDLRPGEDRTIRIHFPTNVASLANGATATGDGIDLAALIDGTEATSWQNVSPFDHAVTVDPPSPAAGSYGAAGADFGPAPPAAGLAGDIVLVDDGSANPTEGCEPLVGFPAGSIALVDRGNCAFVQKARNAQAAGASAMVVANNVPGAPFDMGGNAPDVTIPGVMISLPDGATIKAGLPATGSVASVDVTPPPVPGTQVVVALDGAQTIALAKASAMVQAGGERFTAVRQFALQACTAGGPDNPTCDGGVDAGWQQFLLSHPDAFPGSNPRPTAPDLQLRTFEVPTTTATHVRFVVVTNQCTGNPRFQGDQHNDPTRTADCRVSTTGGEQVRAAQLELLTSRPRVEGATVVD